MNRQKQVTAKETTEACSTTNNKKDQIRPSRGFLKFRKVYPPGGTRRIRDESATSTATPPPPVRFGKRKAKKKRGNSAYAMNKATLIPQEDGTIEIREPLVEKDDEGEERRVVASRMPKKMPKSKEEKRKETEAYKRLMSRFDELIHHEGEKDGVDVSSVAAYKPSWIASSNLPVRECRVGSLRFFVISPTSISFRRVSKLPDLPAEATDAMDEEKDVASPARPREIPSSVFSSDIIERGFEDEDSG